MRLDKLRIPNYKDNSLRNLTIDCPFAHFDRTFGINDKRISVSGLTKFAISIE
jgi:hypothetical protein